MVVADFVESDGFYAVGFLVAETVGAGGLESYSEAFAGKSDGRIEIRAVGEVDGEPPSLPPCRGEEMEASFSLRAFTKAVVSPPVEPPTKM